jgi:GntR family transcriptional regulator, transcriptional repressor for pyruvate dehydrogenase complex
VQPDEAPRGFGPIGRDVRLSDRVADEVLKSILARGLKPGDPLPAERELADQFEVSRTVVREAVRSLVGKGIIEARAGRGLTVAAVDPATMVETFHFYVHGSPSIDLAKIHEVRTTLEVHIAGLAADNATPEDLGALVSACEAIEAAPPGGEAHARADVAFHRALAAASENDVYVLLLDVLARPLIEVRRATSTRPGGWKLAGEQHREILERVVARDAAGARQAMQSHLDTAMDAIKNRGHSGGSRERSRGT